MPADRPRFIVSGGGTGGHVFPAIAIADELRRLRPEAEFLFVGAKGRMEMEKVPNAGYPIEGLWISGLQRRLTLDNLSFPLKVMSSLYRSRRIVGDFQPDVAIGTGGYAGGPVLYAAASMGVPTLIQEPNAFAGLANKWLGKKVDKICVAFPGMGKFFPENKLVITGNPVRESLLERSLELGKEQTDETQRVLLMGGSGGARSLNEAMHKSTEQVAAGPQVQWTWQCGKNYYDRYRDCATARLPNVKLMAFIDRMDEAYAGASVIVGRAGSTTIAEIEYLGKASILVPSPWVAEDHQTRNAESLVAAGATILLPDAEVERRLVSEVLDLLGDEHKRRRLAENAKQLARPGAVHHIAQEVLSLIGDGVAHKSSGHAVV